MAKKKKNENTLSYLQVPLPEGGKYSKMTKVSFGGLNKRYTLDSGELSMESNISTNEYPYLTPSSQRDEVFEKYEAQESKTPISMHAFDDFLIVVYVDGLQVKLDYIEEDGTVHTGILQDNRTAIKDWDIPRSIVQFNVYDTPTDPLTGQYVKKLLIFPDKKSMFMKIVKAKDNPELWTTNDLNSADLDVMYWYGENNKQYYTVASVAKTNGDDGYDKDRVTYKSVLVKKSEYENEKSQKISDENAFFCDGMEVVVKTYYNDKSEVDKSGATIYPPPDTASHNCYYRNTYNHKDTNHGTDVYKWCEYETVDENGNKDGGITAGWKVSISPSVPNIKHATVHLSRVFGVDDDRVYASAYNNYASWNLDTIDEYNEANAWCSPSQSNTKAGGKFTGITTFQNHVICFKHDFMHEIYNTKNPFRIQDIYAEGAIDNRTLQDVDGKLIFVSEDDVKIYTGSNPRIIGHNLNMPKYAYAVAGTDNRNYYLYCEDASGNKYVYVYDTFTGLWSEQSVDKRVLSFAHNKNGMYMLDVDGVVYKMDTDYYSHNWSFETDLITNKTVDIKHIKKLQMLVDVPEVINGVNNYADEDKTPANLKVYILYDDEVFDDMEPAEKAKRLVYTSKKYGRLPIRVKPRKTSNYGFKLHFEGAGYVKLYELEIFVEQGGAMYV